MHARCVQDDTVVDAAWQSDHTMRVRRYDDPAAFESEAGDFLLAREAEHNLILGLLSELRSPDSRYPEHYLATVTDDDQILACALRTPPFQVALSHIEDPEAVDALVDDLYEADPRLSGVLADRASAERFVSLWCERTGAIATRAMEQRIHVATRAERPLGIEGSMRDATEEDRDVLRAWFAAFDRDTGGVQPIRELDERVTHWLTSPERDLVLWVVDDGPVSMAGSTGPTLNGVRVGAVYTPPELRGRGYATANVAALTRRLFDSGRRFCFLYTDLANPVSNAIYAKIGYAPVCDVDQYRFGAR